MLAILTLGAWAVLLLTLIARRSLVDEVTWTPWDIVRGARATALDRFPSSVTQRLAVVTEACERAAHSLARADRADAELLAKVVQTTAGVFVRQLSDDVRDYRRQAQAISAVVPVCALDLLVQESRRMARSTLNPIRLTCPTLVLRLRLFFVLRRLQRLKQQLARPEAPTVAKAQALHSELALSAHAVVACSNALLVSLEAARHWVARRADRSFAVDRSALLMPSHRM